MNDSKTSKKEQKTSFKEIIIPAEDQEEVEVPEDKDFGLHPSELEDEASQRPEIEVPEREKDVEVQVKELPDPTVREEQAKPSMLTIQKSEAIKQTKQTVGRCPLDATLACTDCRWYQPFLGTEHQRTCSIVRIAHQMPL